MNHPYWLTELTLVLGPPMVPHEAFTEFQAAVQRGNAVVEHSWAHHEYAALDALTHREGSVATRSLLETFLGGVLQVGVIVTHVDRRWVRHADGQLYAALTICSEDVLPRAAGQALHEPAAVEALDTVAGTISTLDGREWIRCGSRTWNETASEEHTRRTVVMISQMADLVLHTRAISGDEPIEVVDDLVAAIRHGRALADLGHEPLARELQALRHRDPLRSEWARITMDAFYLASLDVTRLPTTIPEGDARGLAFLYLGPSRTERLKADSLITPRYRGELVAKTLMTAYALERLAPRVAHVLFESMVNA